MSALRLLPFILLFALGVGVTAGVFIRLRKRRIVQPLQTLSETIRKFADGDRSLRATSTAATDDEVEWISSSFNYLAERVENERHHLEQELSAKEPVSFVLPAESDQVIVRELERLYRSVISIETAKSEADVFQVSGQILRGSPYAALLLRTQKDEVALISASEKLPENIVEDFTQTDSKTFHALQTFLSKRASIASNEELPEALNKFFSMLGVSNAITIPITGGASNGALIVGSKDVAPLYGKFAEIISASAQRVYSATNIQRRLDEVEALASMNELSASMSDIQEFYQVLLARIQHIIGDYSLTVALYDEATNTINVPFAYEDGAQQFIPNFPLGEGLTSILLRTRQPLLIAEDTERRVIELGAKIVGNIPKSLIGAPLVVQNKAIGALIIQDAENEGIFDEDDLRFFSALANQVAGVVHNTRLLEESKQRTLQVEIAAEIARDISGFLNLDELLSKAVTLIRERFNFYHASIFLLDPSGQYAVVREATGEAGAQMKRENHKIGIGSKSVIGYVTGKGEALVVGDTAKDMTYYSNPLLPDTKSEAAFPLKASDRILGALDVQGAHPYAFTDEHISSLKILADQLAVAVENSELFAETQEHLAQHRLLHHITSSAASGTTLEEALESAINGLQVTLGGDRIIILLMDSEKRVLEVKASAGYLDDVSNLRVEIGQGVTGWVAEHKRPLRIGNVEKDARYIGTGANTQSELAIPLIYRNEILGVINAESEQLDAYSQNDEEMLGTLGGSLAAIIANARLLEQIRSQSERERLVNEITERIRRSTDIQSILQITASEISRVTGARYAKIQVESQDNSALSKEYL